MGYIEHYNVANRLEIYTVPLSLKDYVYQLVSDPSFPDPCASGAQNIRGTQFIKLTVIDFNIFFFKNFSNIYLFNL